MDAEQLRTRDETKLADAVAQHIYDRRTELGWTTADFAALAGIDERVITDIEDGARLPDDPSVLRLTEVLDGRLLVDVDGLVDRHGLNEMNAGIDGSRAEETYYWDAEDMFSAERLCATVDAHRTLTTTNAYGDPPSSYPLNSRGRRAPDRG